MKPESTFIENAQGDWMMLDSNPAQTGTPQGRAAGPRLRNRHVANLRGNSSGLVRYIRERRRDNRFPLLPASRAGLWMIAACLVAIIAMLAAFLDASAVPLHRSFPPAILEAFGWLTEAGRSDWFLIPAALIILAAQFFEPPRRATRAVSRRSAMIATSAYIFLTVGLTGLVALAAKNLIGRARPKHFDLEGIWSFDPLGFDHSWTSFPSGHSTTAGAVAVIIWLLWPAWRLPGVALCAAIAYSRVVVGAHYPSDIVAGFALGALLAWLIARAFARRRLVFSFDDRGRLRRRGVQYLARSGIS